uniref:Thyroglobulin type-1 domain-containing protein n=1 Tax=Panagrolaimus sp. PS1159 TaxID=55785 RepID=A0AC35G8N6_9BILA
MKNGHGDDERGGLDDERCKREILCTEKDLNGPKICGTKREFQLKLIRLNSIKYANEFVPICDKETKLYAKIQCHSVIGYCWCSTNHGNPIPSTSVAISTHKMPDCHHINATFSNKIKKGGCNSSIHVGADGKIEKLEHSITTNATECSNVERIIFNSNILDVYRREYENVPDEHSPHRGDETGETVERKILVWRFNKLDIDENGQLSMDELSPERRLTVLLVKPITCARNFHKFCDKNSDRLIDLQEWTTCLKIDFGSKCF